MQITSTLEGTHTYEICVYIIKLLFNLKFDGIIVLPLYRPMWIVFNLFLIDARLQSQSFIPMPIMLYASTDSALEMRKDLD